MSCEAPPGRSMVYPIAQASVGETETTLVSVLRNPAGLGLATVVQSWPSQWDVNVLNVWFGVPVLPAIHASDDDEALSPERLFREVGEKLGSVTCVQVEPSQCSTLLPW